MAQRRPTMCDTDPALVKPADPWPVLVVHNAYRQRGGEDAVVAAEVELLRSRGHAVHTYLRQNDEISARRGVALAVETLWSRRTVRDIETLIKAHRPAVVHVHNTLPLVSPSVYWTAARSGIAVVQTLHNFRLVCPQALMLRKNNVCDACIGHVPWRAVVHSCYRNSPVQSAMVATMLQAHRLAGTWNSCIDRYIALNEFSREQFVAGGLPADRIRVKPNFVDLPAPPDSVRQGLLFVGRLSPEKGVATLAQALRTQPPVPAMEVRVAGEGPERDALTGLPSLRLLGVLKRDEVIGEMQRSVALVVPSIWMEMFGLVVIEAFANGLPVIASKVGALSTLVSHGRTGLLVEPSDPAALMAAMRWAVSQPARMREMGQEARRVYENEFAPQQNYRTLMQIYGEARDHAQHRQR